MKILFTYDYGQDKRDEIASLGYTVDLIKEQDVNDYDDKENIDILICYNPFKYVNLKAFKNLKYILLSSIGFDQLPLKDVEEMGITVCNNRGGYSIPMGEWIVMKILELTKHSKVLYEHQERKNWFMDTSIQEVFLKRVLFLGTGTIAQEAAKRLQGFEMDIVGFNTNGRTMPYFETCYPLSEVKDHIKDADYIVCALPLTDVTTGFINKAFLDLINENACFINIARGAIVDEVYLTKKLKNKEIKAAALDVFVKEPLTPNHDLYTLENISISCHNSWISERRNQRRYDIILKNLQLLMKNESLINVIDLKKGY